MEGLNVYSGSDPITVPMKDTSPSSSAEPMDCDDEPTQIEESETFTRLRKDDIPSLSCYKDEEDVVFMPMSLKDISSSFVLESQKEQDPSIPSSQKGLIDCPADLYFPSNVLYRYKPVELKLKLPTGWREKYSITFSSVLSACLNPKVYCKEDLEHELKCPRCGVILSVRQDKEIPIMKMEEGKELFTVIVRTLCTSSKEHLPGKNLVLGIDIPGCKRCYSHTFNVQSRCRPKKQKISGYVSREKLTVFQPTPKHPKERRPKRRNKRRSMISDNPPEVEKCVVYPTIGANKRRQERPIVFNPSSPSSSPSPPPSSSSSSLPSDSDKSSDFIEAEGKIPCVKNGKEQPEPHFEKPDETEQESTALTDVVKSQTRKVSGPMIGTIQSANPRQRTIAFGSVCSDSSSILPFSLPSPSLSFVVGSNPAVIQYLDSTLSDGNMESLLMKFKEYMVSSRLCKEDGIMFFSDGQSSKYIIISISGRSFISHLENYLSNTEPGIQNIFQKNLLESHLITLLGNFVLSPQVENTFSDENLPPEMSGFTTKFMDWYQKDN